MTPLLQTYRELLQAGLRKGNSHYVVPGLWLGASSPVTCSSGYSYLLQQLDDIERAGRGVPALGTISTASIYAASVRQLTSYDHGEASRNVGWRRTGTFLKVAALVPYLLKLKVNTLLLSPVTSIGFVGRKGSLGSPYAVKDPYTLDHLLLEPNIALSLEDQARVLVECCHHVGIQVVMEFALRTASIDADNVRTHPEWYYWVDESRVQERGGFAAPEFTDRQVGVIETMVARQELLNLPAPNRDYTELFRTPPIQIERDSCGWRGVSDDGSIVRIPEAFADWPVRDPQPAWTDVTYLKLYDHPDFNYMAYNTIRMYDAQLQQIQNRNHELWEFVAQIIPSFVEKYNIDGALIDMGHALPSDLLAEVVVRVRRLKSSFIMLEEQFALDRESVRQGYDAVVGSLPFVALNTEELRQYLDYLTAHPPEQRYLATSETHNTPRTYSRVQQELVPGLWLFLQALPGALPMIHSGLELGEMTPVNTGLGFSTEEQQRWKQESLPLFSDVPLCWDQGASIASSFMDMAAYRSLVDHDRRCERGETIESVLCSIPTVLAYIRWDSRGLAGLLACWNSEPTQCGVEVHVRESVMVHLPDTSQNSGVKEVHLRLKPGECLLFSVSKVAVTTVE